MQRIARVLVSLTLVWALGGPPATVASAGTQETSRFVVFEAFMRPT
jgi:hypothetical protein